jgi:predicted site-specific integrase-resolvase
MTGMDTQGKLWTRRQVADLFNVDPRTVHRWHLNGKLIPVRTPGGHTRYKDADIQALLTNTQADTNENGSHSE